MSLRSQLPSPNAIFMFEASARCLNFTHAAQEFNVTQSAMSRMIARLEQHLSVRLFQRTASGLSLTPEGTILFEAVTPSFRQIEEALAEIRYRHRSSGTVTISASSAFTMHWVLPRFSRFKASVPEIDLRFQLYGGEPVATIHDVDLAIGYNLPASSPNCWKLADEIVFPVCSPGYLLANGALDGCSDFSRHTFAHFDHSERLPWSRYLAESSYPSDVLCPSLTFSDYSLVIQTALRGGGIALGWWHVVSHELNVGGLVKAGSRELRTGATYSLVAPGKRPLSRPTAIVRDWLIAEIELLRHPT